MATLAEVHDAVREDLAFFARLSDLREDVPTRFLDPYLLAEHLESRLPSGRYVDASAYDTCRLKIGGRTITHRRDAQVATQGRVTLAIAGSRDNHAKINLETGRFRDGTGYDAMVTQISKMTLEDLFTPMKPTIVRTIALYQDDATSPHTLLRLDQADIDGLSRTRTTAQLPDDAFTTAGEMKELKWRRFPWLPITLPGVDGTRAPSHQAARPYGH